MTIIKSVFFKFTNNETLEIALTHEGRAKNSTFETTIITGKNGSNKSTLLNQLVTSLVVDPEHDTAERKLVKKLNSDKHQVFCISGSAADRFPQKELSSGKRSPFDVPHYTYVGQRVMNNLLSRKAPLETMLAFALAPRVRQRCSSQFFINAHQLIGIEASVDYKLRLNSNSRSLADALKEKSLHEIVSSITLEEDKLGYIKRRFGDLSFATAQWLLKEFSLEDFKVLQDLFNAKKFARFLVGLDSAGASCEKVQPNILRLGLYMGLIQLEDAEVSSLLSNAKFSVLELSSGEYHMFSTILALGFGLDEKSVLLIDEPENSLHPQWQRDLMAMLLQICSEFMLDGHLIISTHSPLIVGSAPEGSTVVDMTNEGAQVSEVAYGASADELLLAQFGIGSSRNRVVVDTVQQAISYVERGNFEDPRFKALLPNLKGIRDALSESDPMIEVIDALIG